MFFFLGDICFFCVCAYTFICMYVYTYVCVVVCVCVWVCVSECVREHIHIQIYIGCIYNIYNIHTPRLPHGRWHTHVGARWRYAVLCYCRPRVPRCTMPHGRVMAAWWTSSCRGGPTSTWRGAWCVQGVGCLFFCGEMLVSFLVEVILFMCVHVCIHICIHIYIYYIYIYAYVYIYIYYMVLYDTILYMHIYTYHVYYTNTHRYIMFFFLGDVCFCVYARIYI